MKREALYDIVTNQIVVETKELEIEKPTIVLKAWGKEIIIHNDHRYCGKVLVFNPNAKFSMHFHIEKEETWYVSKGSFTLAYIDTDTATKHEKEFKVGDTLFIGRGMPHQLIAGEHGGEVFEVSTEHFDDDSYRVEKGDSQI
jgi:mannose-6-phosphate isomerase-like protein (cupin superfamily)